MLLLLTIRRPHKAAGVAFAGHVAVVENMMRVGPVLVSEGGASAEATLGDGSVVRFGPFRNKIGSIEHR